MRYSQAIDASGVLQINNGARCFVLDSTGAAASVDVELLRASAVVFNAPGVERGFSVTTSEQPFDGVRIKAAAGTVVAFFLANELVKISTVQNSDVAIPDGVEVTNTVANRVPVDVGGGVINVTATDVGLLSPDTLAGAADVSINATTTAQVIAADAVNVEREVIIKNLYANTDVMRIAGATAAAALGHELAPGESITLNTTAAVYAYNAGAAAQSVSVLVNSRA